MIVDKNLFLYDLAVVAVVKNEAPYVKEWLDYHLAAGVNHFYIYDNESSDNLRETLQPYIDSNIVTYTFYPGQNKKFAVYNEAFKDYKFFCRYMAFIDVDEFIYPQTNQSIVEIADKIFMKNFSAGGIAINSMQYGSNFQEKADYSRGVLERFTRHAFIASTSVKNLVNPRKIKYLSISNRAVYFDGITKIEDSPWQIEHSVLDKILINRYEWKSGEEFAAKQKNTADEENEGKSENYFTPNIFNHESNNDVLDEGILKYRDSRKEQNATQEINPGKLIEALFQNIAPILNENVTPEFFVGKMETFLVCRALASYLKENTLDETRGNFIEKATLNAIHQAAITDLSFADAILLVGELPKFLSLNYPVVEDIRQICLEIIPQMQDIILKKMNRNEKDEYWSDFNYLDDLLRILRALDNYAHK